MNNFKPFKHQLEAINEIINSSNGLKNKDRIQLIMSCGTGKSLTSMWIHERFVNDLENSITVLFYPSLFLVNQTYNIYKENTILKFNPLVVCSEKAIGENENDDVFEIDLNEVKYPVTTNIEDIKIYIQDKSIKHKIIFVTYQSSTLIGEALRELNVVATLGIFDEAHKTSTSNIDSKFAYGLKDENIPIEKRLFMTATAKHIKFNINNKENEDVEVFSMDNTELYGTVAYEYSMRKAISDKIITDYKILGILIDDKYIDNYTNELKPYSEDVINEAKIKAINEAMKKYNLNKALIFNKDIAASKEIEKYSNTKIFDKTIKHLDGKSSHSYRETAIQELKDSLQYVITNAKLFTEGVDLPAIDMVALFRNVRSEIDIIQTIGRVVRVDKNNPNKVGYILLPIFVSNLDNIDEELKTNQDLLYTYEIINSLKENDEQLSASLEFKKQSKSKRKSKAELDKSKTKNPNFEIDYISTDSNIPGNYIEEINEKITHKIETVIISKRGTNKTKEEWKTLFKEYDNEFGIDNLTKRTLYKNEYLGHKFSGLLSLYKKSTIKEQKEMRIFWDCIPKDIWKGKKITEDEWKELFIDYSKEIGFKNFTSNTKYKGSNLGFKLSSIKNNYFKLSKKEQEKIRKDWDCIPLDLWEKKLENKTNEEWIELFTEYNKKFGIENLKINEEYKGNRLWGKYAYLKNIYNTSDTEKQKEMADFWSCIPNNMWKNKLKMIDEWKRLFVDYDNEIGLSNLTKSTKYNGDNLGQKFYDIKLIYTKSKPEKQKEIAELWDCIPESMFRNILMKDSEYWKQIFLQYDKEIGLNNLTTSTVYKGENLGIKISDLRHSFRKSSPEKQNEMKKIWDFIPEIMLGDNNSKTKEEWKGLFEEYSKEFGTKAIEYNTKYKCTLLGKKLYELKNVYDKAGIEKQKEMLDFWDCIPMDIWLKNTRAQNKKEIKI